MKNNLLENDYQKAIVVLIKEKYPSLIFGCIVCFFAVYFVTQTVQVGMAKRHKEVLKKDVLSISEVKTYTVQQGDDLWKIAEKFYGSGFNAYDIAKLNRLEEPYSLNENQILLLPSTKAKKPTQGEITESAPSTQRITEYVVKPGEYLWQIAEKIYGDGNQMSKLIDANRLPYPYNVEEDQKLIVP